MDDPAARDRDTQPGSDPDDHVGLGRVVEDRLHATGSADAVEEASADSFPASDPPTFSSDTATPADRTHDPDEAIELPAPKDVP